MNYTSKTNEKNHTLVDGAKVDTTTGEIINDSNKNEANANSNNTDDKAAKNTEKRPLTESEAREYIASLPLKDIDIPELYEVMQVPSYSRYEFRMAAYVMLWARKNNIDYEFDKKGNIYLTKGNLEEGEFYPCVTSHMDTVQDKAKPYALAGAELPLCTRRTKSTTTDEHRHEIYIEGQGIGADDKLGVYICLQLIKTAPKIKAVFFVEEEVGMLGSKEMNVNFFNDVSYVLGWDSPDLYRAAWRCSGETLFSADFYKNILSPIVSKWGFTDKCFHQEPFTDICQIRKETGVMCMNFGNGGYNAHSPNEYLVIEHVNHAIGMGRDIIKNISTKERYILKATYSYGRTVNGFQYSGSNESEEVTKLEKIFDTYRYNYSSNTNYNNSSTKTNNSSNSNNTIANNGVDDETVKYIVETYDSYINELKADVENKCGVIEDIIKDKFKEAGIDFTTFEIDLKKELTSVFSKEIKF